MMDALYSYDIIETLFDENDCISGEKWGSSPHPSSL
jgi:hypothetical protein